MRRALGIWQAIMMILLISGMMIVVLKYASISAKHVANTYISEQNELFLNSAIEQALLAIAFHDRTSGCLGSFSPPDVTVRGITYHADVTITRYYLQEGSQDLALCPTLGYAIKPGSALSHGMALLEIRSSASKGITRLKTTVRRTLQQP
ncbi:MAG: hypothetical protein DSZ03_07665 [Sulfurimonas sp.]|nr:MAG: hypothetical protein DSZ03_07665 [Sulfurimonas sp.]